ncbi:NAD-dependent epimerase/dehydratase family protein [Archangium sp.]|uniref:NAD-dependent epimerase/dehydratase family protein n=1 Tax=Archangium sp. TaxID=1872627 RepID=UPI002EDB9670
MTGVKSEGQGIGLVESFAVGDHAKVERALELLRSLGVTELRTEVSWADAVTPEGERWYGWLLPRLAQEVRVVPCFTGTPGALGVEPRRNAPPREAHAFGDFVESFLARHGRHVEWVELWNAPGTLASYDWRLDPEWEMFSAMVADGARRARAAGKKVVLGAELDALWLACVLDRVGADSFDAVAVQGYPNQDVAAFQGWEEWLAPIRMVLAGHRSKAAVWLTTGYSTWRFDEKQQLSAFLDATAAPVERLYWCSLRDTEVDVESAEAPADVPALHFGMVREDGSPKLLFRLWAEHGLAGLPEQWRGLESPYRRAHPERHVVVFGGAGFLGANVAHRYLEDGQRVLVYDNLSRPGVERNLRWLKARHGARVDVQVADLRDAPAVREAVRHAQAVFHFSARVAGTTRLTNPVHDFEVNARGTVNVLDAVRACETPPPLVFTSTHQVYGGLPGLSLAPDGRRYEPVDVEVRGQGLGEEQPLDFESPSGCSKGAADQYVLDYARTWRLPLAVFRMGCIYGPRQFGFEDQGWVAHFLRRTLRRQPITLYGDGRQVRDLLFVEDGVRAFQLAMVNMSRLGGQVFNIGGGPQRAVSLLEVLDLIGELTGQAPQVKFEDWRTGDPRYYVSDTRKFQAATGWAPRVEVREGVTRLHAWMRDMGAGTVQRALDRQEAREGIHG